MVINYTLLGSRRRIDWFIFAALQRQMNPINSWQLFTIRHGAICLGNLNLE